MPQAQLGELQQPLRIIIDDPANKYMSQTLIAAKTEDGKIWQAVSAVPTGSIILLIWDPTETTVLEQYLVSMDEVIKTLFLAREAAQKQK